MMFTTICAYVGAYVIGTKVIAPTAIYVSKKVEKAGRNVVKAVKSRKNRK